MRTTLNSTYSRINTDLNNLTGDLEKINSQISSGSQMSKISDDPVNLVSALRFRSSIAELEQYTKNIDLGTTTITGSEDALRAMKELTIRAKELTIQAINPVLSESEHTAIAEEVKNLNEQAVMLANSQINGKYIFAGQRTTGYTDAEQTPFVMDQGNGQWLNGTAPTASLIIPADTLKINGIPIEGLTGDSAKAKASAINAATSGAAGTAGTGVTAEVISANVQGAVVPGGNIGAGNFSINGVDIAPVGLTVSGGDSDNLLVDAINLASTATGVKATRDADGKMMLTAVDGENIVIAGTDTASTGLINGVTYGSVKLSSDREFTLEDSSVAKDAYTALGITAGAVDGKIDVFSIHKQSGTVRYNGDFENDLKIKIGKVESMVIGFNGKKAVADTGIFTALQQLKDSLRGSNYTSVSGTNAASETGVGEKLDSGATGLEVAKTNPFVKGNFDITILDHDYEPPTSTTMTINVDPTVDSLSGVKARIDGVPNISASFNSDFELVIQSDNPDRYTFSLGSDTSNFLNNTGVDFSSMQYNGLNQSLDNIDFAMNSITEQVSSFGAKANRIDVQSQIYSGLQLAAQTNLSAVQDTDIIKAIMDLKSKETAYQATLSAAAKTMQLSLVDFL